MATKRTGRPPGRPRKQNLSLPKRKRGQPKIHAAEHRERYARTFIQAFGEYQKDTQGLSEQKAAEGIIALLNGFPTGRAKGGKLEFSADVSKLTIKGGANDRWRDKNAFRPLTDNVLRLNRSTRNDYSQDGEYHVAMTVLWKLCLSGWKDDALYIGAEALADSIGEGDYFRQKMFPLWCYMVQEREAGHSGGDLPVLWLKRTLTDR
jgi:hypothetical protein